MNPSPRRRLITVLNASFFNSPYLLLYLLCYNMTVETPRKVVHAKHSKKSKIAPQESRCSDLIVKTNLIQTKIMVLAGRTKHSYLVTGYEINMTKNQFIDKYGENIKREDLTVNKARRNDSSD